MTNEQRRQLMQANGRHYSGTGYYRDAREGFNAFKSFKPYAPLAITEEDWRDFAEGFEEVHRLRNAVVQAKRNAGDEILRLLAETKALD